MVANRATDTNPERRLRSALHQMGLRFRKDQCIEAGAVRTRPDIVFSRAGIAVFLDGCFWHQCPEHGTLPTTNRDYWEAKLRRNVTRDRLVDASLRGSGWVVIRVWEHEEPSKAARRVALAVASRRAP